MSALVHYSDSSNSETEIADDKTTSKVVMTESVKELTETSLRKRQRSQMSDDSDVDKSESDDGHVGPSPTKRRRKIVISNRDCKSNILELQLSNVGSDNGSSSINNQANNKQLKNVEVEIEAQFDKHKDKFNDEQREKIENKKILKQLHNMEMDRVKYARLLIAESTNKVKDPKEEHKKKFNTKEKRKRKLGQVNRDGSVVEEEKRLLRQMTGKYIGGQ
ncbi:hypothetical protein RFI_05250 [Reticulomyxa filosa]|uniref:Uncharacterized protein n=1 Tax=Reticulomyxa filosa TaxID=46433 RepID=X6P2U2_RETFI|nr:hypothetical protein RFI_05250 [Reticulomyxa filosa]|eukprot:ETO31867.1 hypothetical protein RFI_05250 [Reticulomyxa filosa]